MATITSQADDFGKHLCDILKLDSRKTKTITITVTADDVVTVDVQQYLQKEEGSKLLLQLNRYDLVKSRKNVIHKCDDIAWRPIREKLNLSLRDVEKQTGVSASTISRIEHGKECLLSNVEKLNNFYNLCNGQKIKSPQI